MCLIPYLKVYHGSKKCLGSFFSNGLLCWERGNALNPLRVNLFLMLVFIGPKSLPFNAFSLKSLQISLVWFSRNRLKMANPFCLLVKRPSAADERGETSAVRRLGGRKTRRRRQKNNGCTISFYL